MKQVYQQQIARLTQLSNQELADFFALGKSKHIPRKTRLATPDRVIDRAYFLEEGVIRHYVKDGVNEFTKNFIRGPHFMVPSLTNFFLEIPTDVYCESLTDLQVTEWSRKDLFLIADRYPKMYKFLLRAVVKAFHGKETKEIALHQQSAKERYLNFLESHPNLINEIPIQYVASYLGVRPETLSRIRAEITS